MKLKDYILLFGISVLAGCGGSASKDELDFTLDDFEQVPVTLTEYKMNTGDQILGLISQIKVIDGRFVVMKDSKNLNQVYIYDTERHEGISTVRKGAGPQEVSYVTNLFEVNGRLGICSGTEYKMLLFDIIADSLSLDLAGSYTSLPQSLRYILLSDEATVVTMPITDQSHRLYIKHDNDHVDTLGSFPIIDSDYVKPNNMVLQADMALCNNETDVVVANRMWNSIEIHNLETGESIIKNGPVKIDSQIKSYHNSIGTGYYTEPSWSMYQGVCSTNHGFMTGYIGRRIESQEDIERNITSLLLFDADGNPLKSYVLDREIDCFDYDRKTGYLYCVTNEPEPMIFCVDIGVDL